MTTFRQLSLSGGEIAPQFQARVDLTKYMTGLKTARNVFIQKGGGALNRAGTQFSGEAKDSTRRPRLRDFVYSDSTGELNYAVEFGHQYVRFHQDGDQVLEAAKTITGITAANPPVVTTSGAHSYSTGHEVRISGSDMTQANGRNFKITVLSATTFSLQDLGGTNVDASSWTVGTSGSSRRVYTLSSNYDEADLYDLKFTQILNRLYITHRDYAPLALTFTSETSWSLSSVSFMPSIDNPYTQTGTGTGSSAVNRYRVTAVDEETGEESWHSVDDFKTITAITNANPAVVTVASHGYTTGDSVLVTAAGMTEVTNKGFTITVLTANTFELDGVNSTSYGVFTVGAAYRMCRTVTADEPTKAAPITITWLAVTGAKSYNVYKEFGGVYGYIGSTVGTKFYDTGITPDTSDGPEVDSWGFDRPFDEVDQYPGVCGSYQQRLWLANTNDDSEQVRGSQTGAATKFTTHIPLQASDGVAFRLAGRRINEVRHIVDIGKLVLFTANGEWVCEGNEAGIVTPYDINAKQYGFHGASNVPPIVIDGSALFIQSRGNVLRSFGYRIEDNSFGGGDLSIFASHLFEGHTIVDWAYVEVPTPIVWIVRDDGLLISFTYLKEQDIWAFAKHDFQGGEVESVCAVPESLEDKLYVVVKRTINSREVRYIERMATRLVDADAPEDMIFMDSSLTYDGWDTTGYTATLTGASWNSGDEVTLTMSGNVFTSEDFDVDNEIHYVSGDTTYRWQITAYTSATVVTVRLDRDLPVALQATALSGWGYAADEMGGLYHMAGEEVSILGDGTVVAGPYNEDYETVTVSATGTVVLGRPYVVAHVGLPYISDIETLSLDSVQGETRATSAKEVTSVGLYLDKTRGVWTGPQAPDDDDTDPVQYLVEMKLQEHEDYDQVNQLFSGVEKANIEGKWDRQGHVFVRQIDPIPMAVMAVYPGGYL